MTEKKENSEKTRLHSRNRNRENYDLSALQAAVPELTKYIKPNQHGAASVNFADPNAVKLLNKALLQHYYGVENWDFPPENLCPPIPGRADYLHYMADLLAQSNFGMLPEGEKITVLDVGTGASCIYPILGVAEYGWNFLASDISQESLDSATKIIQANSNLKGKITCRPQQNPAHIFQGILGAEERIDFSMCNPPFHSSLEEAQKVSRRKISNLTGKKAVKPVLNFAGIHEELIFPGGEAAFIKNMIDESSAFSGNCYWFSTLVSKQSTLKAIYKQLDKVEIVQIKTIPMGTGNKSSRIVAWSFLSKDEQKMWRERRWK